MSSPSMFSQGNIVPFTFVAKTTVTTSSSLNQTDVPSTDTQVPSQPNPTKPAAWSTPDDQQQQITYDLDDRQ